MWWAVLIGLVVVVMLSLVFVAVAVVLPVAGQLAERVRIEQQAADASWRIHQQAARVFSQMLEAAREGERKGGADT